MVTRDYPYVSQVRALGREEGRELGAIAKATAVLLHILERRGISLQAADRKVIEACTDLATLDLWLDRAVDITNIGELFARQAE